MRPRLLLLSVAAATAGAALLFHFSGNENSAGQQSAPPQNAEPFAAQPSRDPVESTNAKDGKKQPAENALAQVRGLLIDGEDAVVAQGDILYKFMPGQSASCEEKVELSFELDPSTNMVQSNERGRFEIPLPNEDDPGHSGRCLVLHASKAGYHSTVVNLDLNAQPGIVELELQKHELLQGKVKTPDGRALRSAQVNSWIAGSNGETGRGPSLCEQPDLDSLSSGLSDAQGSFELHVSGKNVYCVQASHADWTSSTAQAVDLSALNAGDIVLTLEAPLSVSGQVSDLDGRPINQLALRLHQQESSQSTSVSATTLSATTDLNGRFSFAKLEPGKYTLSSGDPAYGVASPQDVVVNRGESVSDIEVSVFPLTTITGRILDQAGEPVAGVRVSTRSPYVPDLSTSTATSNDQGHFEIRSEHRSKVVRDMLRMASEFSEAGGAELANETPPLTCLSFYHPRLRSDELAISVAEAQHDVGTIYMEPPRWEFAGVVRNHRNEPVEAHLSFQLINDRRNASSGPPTQCDDSAATREVVTDKDGRFSLHVDDAGRYEVEIKTERYKTRRQQVDLTQAGDSIEIRLD